MLTQISIELEYWFILYKNSMSFVKKLFVAIITALSLWFAFSQFIRGDSIGQLQDPNYGWELMVEHWYSIEQNTSELNYKIFYNWEMIKTYDMNLEDGDSAVLSLFTLNNKSGNFLIGHDWVYKNWAFYQSIEDSKILSYEGNYIAIPKWVFYLQVRILDWSSDYNKVIDSWRLVDADPKSFEYIGTQYNQHWKDRYNVYRGKEKLSVASAESFKIAWNFYKDQINWVYKVSNQWEIEKAENVDTNSFEYHKDLYVYHDDNWVYLGWNRLKPLERLVDANINTLEKVECTEEASYCYYPYLKDQNNVYHKWSRKIVEWADPDLFHHFWSSSFAKDDTSIYAWGNALDLDASKAIEYPKNRTNGGNQLITDWTNVYNSDKKLSIYEIYWYISQESSYRDYLPWLEMTWYDIERLNDVKEADGITIVLDRFSQDDVIDKLIDIHSEQIWWWDSGSIGKAMRDQIIEEFNEWLSDLSPENDVLVRLRDAGFNNPKLDYTLEQIADDLTALYHTAHDNIINNCNTVSWPNKVEFDSIITSVKTSKNVLIWYAYSKYKDMMQRYLYSWVEWVKRVCESIKDYPTEFRWDDTIVEWPSRNSLEITRDVVDTHITELHILANKKVVGKVPYSDRNAAVSEDKLLPHNTNWEWIKIEVMAYTKNKGYYEEVYSSGRTYLGKKTTNAIIGSKEIVPDPDFLKEIDALLKERDAQKQGD